MTSAVSIAKSADSSARRTLACGGIERELDLCILLLLSSCIKRQGRSAQEHEGGGECDCFLHDLASSGIAAQSINGKEEDTVNALRMLSILAVKPLGCHSQFV